MKKLVFGLFLIVGINCRSEAQLNGEYTYDIADIFGTSPFTFQGFTAAEWDVEYTVFNMIISDNSIRIPIASLVHNPLNGSFSLNGSIDFVTRSTEGNIVGEIYPEDLNPQLVGDSWSISTYSPIKVLGKTYTDKKSKKSFLDISSGAINLKGTYTPVNRSESAITKGSISFKASKLNCDRLYRWYEYDYESLKIGLTGSITLGRKENIKLSNQSVDLQALWWGGRSYSSAESNYSTYESFYLLLNLSSNSSIINGKAKVYYRNDYVDNDPSKNSSYSFPDQETPAKEFSYSVKGTRKNGVATLSLTGQGVIKGLKATIYINESTQEIIKNGRNSITLYGQTITY
jgi:hypothetical protein